MKSSLLCTYAKWALDLEVENTREGKKWSFRAEYKIYLILKTSCAAVALNISFCLLKLREFSRVNYGDYITAINDAFSTNLFAHQTLIGY